MHCSRTHRILAVTLLVGSGLGIDSYAQSHFTNCISQTGSSATLIIPASSAPTLDNVALAPGDEIAVYTQQGLCAGAAVWSGANLSVTIWGDDVITSGSDGLAPNEPISYRVWSVSSSIEASIVEVAYSSAQPYYRTIGTYAENAVYAVSKLAATSGQTIKAPAEVRLYLPLNGAMDVPTDVPLIWRSVPGATHYHAQVSLDPTFKQMVIDKEGIQDTTLIPAGLLQGKYYYWRVRAVSESVAGPYSNYRAFVTMDAGGNLNTAPSFMSKPPKNARAGREYSHTVLATDVDGDLITLTAPMLPQWLTFESVQGIGTLSGTPGETEVGDHLTRIVVTDERGAHATQEFTITVVARGSGNLAPEVVKPIKKQTVLMGSKTQSVDLAEVFEDVDDDELSFSAYVSDFGVLEVDVQEAVLQMTPITVGVVDVTVQATDEGGETVALIFSAIVRTNRSPVARVDSYTILEDATVMLDVTANDSDPDGDTLTTSIVTQPPNGTAVAVAGRIRYTPRLDYYGTDTFVYRISDGLGGTASGTVYLEITPVNDAPRFSEDDPFTAPEDRADIDLDQTSAGDILLSWLPAVDPEGSSVSYTWQLSDDFEFKSVLLQKPVGAATQAMLGRSELTTLVAQRGFDLSLRYALYLRIAATDGREESFTSPRQANLMRASITSSPRPTSPRHFRLEANYPNPFNPRTTIGYSLEESGHVRIVVHDLLGRHVATLVDGVRPAGRHTVDFDASGLATGQYLYRLEAAGNVATRVGHLIR